MGFESLIKKKYTNFLFTTPSHCQKFCIFNKFRHFYKLDVSETDTHSPEKMLYEAEDFAAKIYNVNQTKFLTNGSSSGIIAATLAVVDKGDNVLLGKNAHRCHINAVKLAGGNPIFYDIPMSESFGIPIGLKANDVKKHFDDNKIKAVIITSPTYEGFVSDIKSIKKLCDKNNSYLIVDEAHGALYPFSDKLPESAINNADFVVQSLHKTAGGLNPTALLHSNCPNIDLNVALDMITTTSPSYPLLLSIEKNIKYLNSTKGRNEIENLIFNIQSLKLSLTNYEFGGDDITKLLIKKDGFSGFELSKILFDKFNIEDEKTNSLSLMLLTGIGTKKGKLDKLKLALKKIK